MRLEEKFVTQDVRLNKIRAEFDMGVLNKFISSKADQVAVDLSYQTQDSKIATLD